MRKSNFCINTNYDNNGKFLALILLVVYIINANIWHWIYTYLIAFTFRELKSIEDNSSREIYNLRDDIFNRINNSIYQTYLFQTPKFKFISKENRDYLRHWFPVKTRSSHMRSGLSEKFNNQLL